MKYFFKFLTLLILFLFSKSTTYADDLRDFIFKQLEAESFLSETYIDEYLYFEYTDDGYVVHNKSDIREWFNDPSYKDIELNITYLDITSQNQIDDFITFTVEYGFSFMETNFIAKTAGIVLITSSGYISLFDAQRIFYVDQKSV